MLTYKNVNSDIITGKHLRFDNKEKVSPKAKTFIWAVMNKHDEVFLGSVKWFSRWRCYSFFPATDTIFEKDCLRDIADFCVLQTDEHKARKK